MSLGRHVPQIIWVVVHGIFINVVNHVMLIRNVSHFCSYLPSFISARLHTVIVMTTPPFTVCVFIGFRILALSPKLYRLTTNYTLCSWEICYLTIVMFFRSLAIIDFNARLTTIPLFDTNFSTIYTRFLFFSHTILWHVGRTLSSKVGKRVVRCSTN